MTFHRCFRLSRLPSPYGSSWLPRLVLSEAVVDFAGCDTVVCYICLTWSGLRRFYF